MKKNNTRNTHQVYNYGYLKSDGIYDSLISISNIFWFLYQIFLQHFYNQSTSILKK